MKQHPIYTTLAYYDEDNTIRNIHDGNIKRIVINKTTGYHSISHKSKHIYVHRFVWECYNGAIELSTNSPQGLTIDHIDNDKGNNRIENLKLLTKRENCRRNNKAGLPYGISKVREHYNIQFCKDYKYYTPKIIGEKCNCNTLEEARIVRDKLAEHLGITLKHELHGMSLVPEQYKVQFFVGNKHKGADLVGEKSCQNTLIDAIIVRDKLAKHLGINI